MNSNVKLSRRDVLVASAATAAGAFQTRLAFAADDQSDTPDLVYLPAVEILKRLRNKEISPVEVVNRFLQRIDEIDPHLNAVTYRPDKQALRQAQAAEKQILRGQVNWEQQPLRGLPVSIKDMFDVEGMPNTCGSPALKNNVAKTDATAVKKLRQAGAIFVARTNVPLEGGALETDNLLHGRTNNPYDKTRTPGGSSGGEAALIAAGGSPLGLGGDAGGSIVVPGHSCGIAGLVPGWGRVSTAGVIPFRPNTGPLYLGCGPMARSVDDLTLMLPVISGEDHRDPFTFPLRRRDPESVEFENLKIAYCTEANGIDPTQQVKNVIKTAAGKVEETGADVVRKYPPYFDAEEPMWVVGAFTLPIAPGALSAARKTVKTTEDPLIREGIQLAVDALDGRDLEILRAVRDSLPFIQQDVLEFMRKHDAILCPVCQVPAMKHGESWERIVKGDTFFSVFFGLIGNLPVGVVRCGTSPEGLPIGVQVVGAPYREDIVLAVMKFLENELGGWQPPLEQAIKACMSRG